VEFTRIKAGKVVQTGTRVLSGGGQDRDLHDDGCQCKRATGQMTLLSMTSSRLFEMVQGGTHEPTYFCDGGTCLLGGFEVEQFSVSVSGLVVKAFSTTKIAVAWDRLKKCGLLKGL
jgi:hypothetical protein